MPYYHCYHCHHEFEDVKAEEMLCDWCGGADVYILEEETPLEKMCKDIEKKGGFAKWWEKINGGIKDDT